MTKIGDFDWNELFANEDLSTRTDNQDESTMRFRSANEPDFIPIPSTYKSITPMPTSALDTPIHKQTWQSSDATKRRYILTLATIGIAGSFLAIGGFIAFTQMVGSKNPEIAAVPIVPQNNPEANQATKTESEPDPNSISTQLENSQPSPDSLGTETELPTRTSGNAVPPIESSSAPSVASDASMPLLDQTLHVPPVDQSVASVPTVASELAVQPAETLGSAFEGLNRFLRTENSDSIMLSIESESSGLNIEDAEVYLAQQFHPPPKAIPVWEKNAKTPLSTFRKKEISLLQCIDVFGRMTGVGITLDWQACRVAGIDINKKFPINETNTTIFEMFEKVVQANGLVWSLDVLGLPVVTVPTDVMSAKMKIDWSVAGLFAGGMEQEGCDVLIRLWGYDGMCRVGEGKLIWSDDATPIEKANMQSSLYELAKLNKLDSANLWSKPPSSLLIFSPSYWNDSFEALGRRIGPAVFAPEKRPISDLLTTAASECKLNLVVDWKSVWGHGLTPSDTAATILAGRTFPQVAERFLGDFELEIAPISEDTVWLTSRKTRRKLYFVVPVRLPKNSKLDDLRQDLRMLAPVVDEQTQFKVVPMPGSEDLFFARICMPRVDQLNDPDVTQGLGWPDRP